MILFKSTMLVLAYQNKRKKMKKILLLAIATGFLISATGCGSSSSTKSKESTPGPFKDGKFGRINLSDPEYDSLGRDEGKKVVSGSVFIDIRNKWERERGQPTEVIKDIIVYQIFSPGGARRTNSKFVEEVGKAVGDKNKKIILICHTSSRTFNAARVLSKNGYTNVYDIEGGYAVWSSRFKVKPYSQSY